MSVPQHSAPIFRRHYEPQQKFFITSSCLPASRNKTKTSLFHLDPHSHTSQPTSRINPLWRRFDSVAPFITPLSLFIYSKVISLSVERSKPWIYGNIVGVGLIATPLWVVAAAEEVEKKRNERLCCCLPASGPATDLINKGAGWGQGHCAMGMG